jgi:ABC-type multidrug transport system fused ATPase/permease subunit
MNYIQFHDRQQQDVFKKGFRTIESGKKKRKKEKNALFSRNSYWRLIKYAARHPIHLFGAITFALLSQSGGIILPFLSGKVLNAISKKNIDELETYCWWYLAGLLICSFSIFFRTSLLVSISDLVLNILKNEAFNK